MKKLGLLFLMGFCFAIHGNAQEAADVEGWTQDIHQYRKTITRKHKNPFTRVSKEEFSKSCDQLISALPDLNDDAAHVQLCRIAASIGDGHTTVHMMAKHIYPLSFYWFEDGLRLLAIENTHEKLLGSKVLYINGVPVEQVVAMVATLIPHENMAQLKLQVPNYLNNAEVLFGLGIIKDKSACKYIFDIGSRVEPEVELDAVPIEKMNEFRSSLAWTKPEKPMLKNENSDQLYWFKVLEKQNAVYVQYKTCRLMDGYSFSTLVEEVMHEIDQMDKPKLIIDLRSNGGGNSSIFAPMLREVSKRLFLNQNDKLFVLIGRRTFSSAILNAMDMRNETNATLLGEASGGKPNHFGEVKNATLKNSGLRFTWSVKYFKVTEGDPDSIIPDQEIPIEYTDYKAGRDLVLEQLFNSSTL